MKRPAWSWLVLVLWIEIIGLLVLRGYCYERMMLIEITNLVAAQPGPDFWRMISSISLILLMIGGALWYYRVYSVIMGLSLFVLGLLVAESVLGI